MSDKNYLDRRSFLMGAALLATPQPPKRVWLIGDSLAWLLHSVLAKTVPEGITYDGNPIGGASVISWATKHQPEIAASRRFRPDFTVVLLGANDAYMGPRIIANERPFLDRLLRRLRGKVVWLGPPDLPRARPGLDAFASMIQGAGLPYLDSRGVKVPMWGDQLHPTEEGRRIWAAWVWPRLTAFMQHDTFRIENPSGP